MWCVETKISVDGTCDIREWENVGIHRTVSRMLNHSSLIQGKNKISFVTIQKQSKRNRLLSSPMNKYI